MAWRGKTRVGSKFGGRHGGLTQIGDVAVPRVAVYAHDGDIGEPDLEVTFEVRDGRPECVDFHVRAKPDGRGIRTADLQMVTNLDASPTAAVRMLLGYKSERTAARRVQQAREAGLLPATTPGKRKA